ncbi:MAG: arginyltransferase [Geminicoccaceae bacterium]|nr:MAG: arginyltransferase [Geminicoccaceae bacterium]
MAVSTSRPPTVESTRASTRLTTFASTELQPCPYLAGREERRLFTIVQGMDADRRHEVLMQAGFRRSQNILYRPICPGCQACRSVRIAVAGFAPSRNLRRVAKHNADLITYVEPPSYSEERYRLFRAYIQGRHGDGGMADMDRGSFRRMLETSPVSTRLIELRDAKGALIAASLTDEVASGLSGVYKFFDPAQAARSLGTEIILRHLGLAAAASLDYVYLGYWIEGSRKMAYKARFRPLEVLAGDRWIPFQASTKG